MTDAPSITGKNQESAYPSRDIMGPSDSNKISRVYEKPAVFRHISGTSLDQPPTLLPIQQHSTQAPAFPDKVTVETPEMVPTSDSCERSEASNVSSPSRVATTSSSFLGSSVSEASSGMSHSFIRPSLNRLGTLGCVVQWLEQWIDQQFQGFVSGCCSGVQAEGRPPSSSPSNNDNIGSGTGERQGAKGKRPVQNDLPDDDSEEESRKRSKRPRPDHPVFGGQRRFACPFF